MQTFILPIEIFLLIPQKLDGVTLFDAAIERSLDVLKGRVRSCRNELLVRNAFVDPLEKVRPVKVGRDRSQVVRFVGGHVDRGPISLKLSKPQVTDELPLRFFTALSD